MRNRSKGTNAVVDLNIFYDDFLYEPEYVSVGDNVYGRPNGEEFNISKNKVYKILDTNGFDLVKVLNDNNDEDWYSIEFFNNYESI
jgi:hypothetical protein